MAQNCTVVNAFRNMHTSPMDRAQLKAFRIYLDATSVKQDGKPNVMHAWYGAIDKEVSSIMIGDGFRARAARDGVGFGFGLHLYVERCALDSVRSSPIDTNGLRHMVVCRVILGIHEVILPGLKQLSPSSDDFDSAVDSLQSTSKYIVWYPNVKTNVLPLYTHH